MASISGIAKKTATERTIAPNIPPNLDEINAADSALAASPRYDIGKPSITVA